MNLAELLAQADKVSENVEINNEEGFSPIEPGTYTVAVTNAEGPCESKRTNPTNPFEHGQYLKIECTISGPKFVGRKLWMNNNIICYPKDMTEESIKNCQKAIAMGSKDRKVMLESIGKSGITDAQELIGATFDAVVVTEKGTGGYKDKSVIKTIKPTGSSSVVNNTQQSSIKENTSSNSKPKMPWEKLK